MRLSLDLSGLKRTRWYEYALRFFFGGAITVATGLIWEGSLLDNVYGLRETPE